MELLDKILIANRGEIALRIIRSAKSLGIATVAIYTESEKEAGYVQLADEAISLGRDDLQSTFLNIDKIITIAIESGAKAIHPGYGFLSENPKFAKTCEEHNLVFIGPCSTILSLMGNKPAAKSLASSLGIRVARSSKIELNSIPALDKQDFPVLIKASFGGGGKGMFLVHTQEDLVHQIEKSSRMAMNYFGNSELFIEQYIKNSRHVEVQIIGDNFNNIIHLYERECSVQRNHQKIIEEAPASFLTPGLRDQILNAALKIGKAVNYSGAGTIEFLIDESGNYYFMEMNPRIQVEHAVTEQITGIDIVCEQLKIASGYPLSVSQDQVPVKGHSIEARIYSENPANFFLPSFEPLRMINLPEHPNLRIEGDIHGIQQLNNQFDPLLFKLISWGNDRISAINLLLDHIANLNIIGPETNSKYLHAILSNRNYRQDELSIEFCQKNHAQLTDYYIKTIDSSYFPFVIAFAISTGYLKRDQTTTSDPWNHLGYWRLSESSVEISADGTIFKVGLILKNQFNPAFKFEGVDTVFGILEESAKHFLIKIGKTIKSINYIIDNQKIRLSCENNQHILTFPGLLKSYPEVEVISDHLTAIDTGEISSHLHGKIVEINIKEDQIIKKGDLLMVIEAMKSENRILSPKDARVRRIAVHVGAQVTDRMPLMFLD